MNLDTTMSAVRDLLLETVGCPHHSRTFLSEGGNCWVCDHSDRIPDPQLQGLRDALLRECKHLNSAWRDTAGLQAFCCDCGAEWEPTADDFLTPKGHYVLAPYESWPPGAFDGAIDVAIEGLPFYILRYQGDGEFAAVVHFYNGDKVYDAEWAQDRALATATALLEALERRKGA